MDDPRASKPPREQGPTLSVGSPRGRRNIDDRNISGDESHGLHVKREVPFRFLIREVVAPRVLNGLASDRFRLVPHHKIGTVAEKCRHGGRVVGIPDSPVGIDARTERD
jgi:hypothetical protein